MSNNYFMSDAFQQDAVKAVQEAVDKADALGLPKAYDPTPVVVPEKTEVVRLTTKKKALAKPLQTA